MIPTCYISGNAISLSSRNQFKIINCPPLRYAAYINQADVNNRKKHRRQHSTLLIPTVSASLRKVRKGTACRISFNIYNVYLSLDITRWFARLHSGAAVPSHVSLRFLSFRALLDHSEHQRTLWLSTSVNAYQYTYIFESLAAAESRANTYTPAAGSYFSLGRLSSGGKVIHEGGERKGGSCIRINLVHGVKFPLYLVPVLLSGQQTRRLRH